ncbi:RecQ family ATP-dependent DNA helicase [Conexibacter sp. W3-3-2]|nr:RecQ family ATP-dependent DNA helicase [Conexibacter sp. W3-3-2]
MRTLPLDALQRYYGHTAFRPGQAEAVAAALDDRDVLVVMPTGAGKSLCYQLPALLRDDLTVVVSPLVSLMQDQVDGLRARLGARGALVGAINGQQDTATNRAVLARAVAGELRLLHVAPERFSSPDVLAALAGARVGLFVVDEAHCVSQWGHDFRPDYFRLGDVARALGARAIVASTATATPQVAQDIAARLGLRDPVRVQTGFDRPALSFGVVPCSSPNDRARRIVHALATAQARPAIVYAGTRQAAETLAARIGADLGVTCAAYHAGLPAPRRSEVQRRFMAGELEIVVATNAFGMGVDKADVRTVAHDGVPASLEAYYQEAGRAGRDGRPARALLFACAKDKGLHVFFMQRSEIDDALLDRVAGRVLAAADADGLVDAPVAALAGTDRPDQVRAIVGHLDRAGVLALEPGRADRVRARLGRPHDADTRDACRTAAGEGRSARAGRSTGRCGRTRRAAAAAARRCCGTSATPPRARRPSRAATSATRPCCPRGPRRRSAAPTAPASSGRRSTARCGRWSSAPRWTPAGRSCSGSATRRTRRRSCGSSAAGAAARSPAAPGTGSRSTGRSPTCRPPRCWRCSARRWAPDEPARRRPRVGCRDEPAGDPRRAARRA